MRTNIEKILVFQQSRVKNNFDERENARRKWNGEKARAFLLQTENMYEETQAIQRTAKVKRPMQKVQANKSIR